MQACNFNIRKTLTRVFSLKFCEIFTNTFFTEHFRATVSAVCCVCHQNYWNKSEQKTFFLVYLWNTFHTFNWWRKMIVLSFNHTQNFKFELFCYSTLMLQKCLLWTIATFWTCMGSWSFTFFSWNEIYKTTQKLRCIYNNSPQNKCLQRLF